MTERQRVWILDLNYVEKTVIGGKGNAKENSEENGEGVGMEKGKQGIGIKYRGSERKKEIKQERENGGKRNERWGQGKEKAK